MINPLPRATPAPTALHPAADPAATADAQRDRLRTTAQAFEAVFLRQVIGSMRQARLADDPFGSQATEQFRDMADSRLADSMSTQGSFGIAEMLMGQFEGRIGRR
jgi:flagellar protein FlgJ